MVQGSGVAHGFVLEGLSDEEWAIIDAFEDDSYALNIVTLKDGQLALAYTCASNDDALHLGHEGWDAHEFAERSLTAYVSQCRAWKSRRTR